MNYKEKKGNPFSPNNTTFRGKSITEAPTLGVRLQFTSFIKKMSKLVC